VEAHPVLDDLHASCPTSEAELSQGEGGLGKLLLLLNEDERLALVRALYVVKDNWWLDEVEGQLLARLER